MVVITLSSTIVGAIKIKDSIEKSKELSKNIQIPEVLGEQEIGGVDLDESVFSPTPKPSVSPASNPKSSAKAVNKMGTQAQFAVSPTSNRCMITLFGNQYDVTQLRTTHSGGDVFVCCTDMTSTYQSRHGTNVSRMSPYLVIVSTPATVPTPAVPVSSQDRDDDDKEDEDRDKDEDDNDDDT